MEWPQRKHLRRLGEVWPARPVYFVTVCTLDRQAVLTQAQIGAVVVEALATTASAHGWVVGRHVLMPDHIQFFCGPGRGDNLSRFVGGFRQESTRRVWEVGWRGRLWQREFFDHLLRSEESYEQKWCYVRRNPVRAGLACEPDEWVWQGEVGVL